MSFRCELKEQKSLGLLQEAPPVHTSGTAIANQQKSQLDRSGPLLLAGDSSRKSCLQFFLHHAPVRCIEAVVRFLDLPSFVVLLSLNSSLLQLCDSSAFQPCWTHFALIQRVLRHGENVLLPSVSPVSPPLLRGSEQISGGRAGGRGNNQHARHEDSKEKVNPCQTFSRLLPRVTRLDLVRIGSLNSNWRNKSFSTEQRQVICSGEALDKAYVLPAPPFASSFGEFSVAPDAPLNLQACPSVGLPACLQPLSVRDSADVSPIFTLLPSTRIFAVHAAARTPRGQFVEVKLPLLPTKIPTEPRPLIRFGGHAPSGWLLGDDTGLPAEHTAATGDARPTTRTSQSQRKKQRQQRQQQMHKLHMSWVHVAPHPLRPCLKSSKAEQSKCSSSREGSPPTFPVSPPFRSTNQSRTFNGSGSPDACDANAGEGIGHCPLVRLLCLCLPPIEIEKAAGAEGFISQEQAHGANWQATRSQVTTEAEQTGEKPPTDIVVDCNTDTGVKCSVSPGEKPAAEIDACTNPAMPCFVDENAHSAATVPADRAERPATLTREHPMIHPSADHVWPVALCSYSPNGSRFLAHAVVCCALREGEKLNSARSRLWYKDKKQKRTVQLNCLRKTAPDIGDETQGSCVRATANGGQQLPTQPEKLSSSNSSIKTVSFSIEQYPLAVFVGMVAVGTSEGRILCTPPPCCLARSCYCGKGCLEALNAGVSVGPCGDLSCYRGAEPPSRTDGAHPTGCQKPLSWEGLSNPEVGQQGSTVPATGSPSGSSSSVLTAAKAGSGVAFVEVGSFGDRGGAVNYVELVRGTPWAPRVQRQDKAQLLTPTQKRDFSWHWTRAPTVAAERGVVGDVSAECSSAECSSASSVPCGGLEAEALWLFACSKETGVKIFRFMWCVQNDAEVETCSAKRRELQAACGRWVCVLTIRGSCQLVSLDLNSGIIALCTPTDSKVYFLCFRHLLPAHIYLPSKVESSVVSAEDLVYFSRCGLPRPQHIPLGGYLAAPQPQFTSVLQSPAQCARLELLVARRPSVLQPVGGRRWVVIDGAVIRVVQIKVTDALGQRNPLDAARQELRRSALTGTPMEQLRQLRRPVNNEPELSWALGPPPAPELQAMRLCVFSHPRTIYHCAFDGVRRLVTVDLREVLMIWDLQRYTKLCDVDLMASGESGTPDRSSSHDIEGYDGDGGDICMSSDGLCSENEAFRGSISRKGGSRGQSLGIKFRNTRTARKGGKLSLKKQFGSDWMQKHVLAHRNSTLHHQGHCALHSTGYSSSSSGIPGNNTSKQEGEGVSVGGVWFSSSSLVPAVQLQSLYDIQNETKCNRSSFRPTRDALQQVDRSYGENRVEAADKKLGLSSDVRELSSRDVGTFISPSEPATTRHEWADETSGADKVAAVDHGLPTAVAASYGDDFPPLSAESVHTQLGEHRKQDHLLPKVLGTAPEQHPSAITTHTGSEGAEAAAHMPDPDTHPEENRATSSRGLSAICCSIPAPSLNGEQHLQYSTPPDTTKCSAADGGARPSFAAVVAAAASSSCRSCPKSGWAWAPTEPSLFIGLLGDEGARALQESASALGMNIEDLYLQQVAEWEQLQRRGHRKAASKVGLPLDERLQCDLNRLEDSNDKNVKVADATKERVAVSQGGGAGLQVRGQSKSTDAADEAFPGSDADSSRIFKTSESPSTHAALGTPKPLPLEESNLVVQPTLCRPPGQRAGSRMVGLLGRHRCVTRLGPNSQRRHVTALCLSETCIALLFKNLKTWQIWTFAPSAGFSRADASEASTERML